jgi:hypothetical protein
LTEQATPPPLVGKRLSELLTLLRDVDSVELEMTVPDADRRPAVTSLEMDPLDAQIRQVWFFDTPDLALEQAGVVVRGRRIQGRGDDAVVTLRPAVPYELPDELRAGPGFVVEVDVPPGGYVCSGSLRARHSGSRVEEAVAGERAVHALSTEEQRGFHAEHSPPGIALDDLTPSGAQQTTTCEVHQCRMTSGVAWRTIERRGSAGART